MKTILNLIIFYCVGSVFSRNFSIDFKNNRFVKDGKTFRYISGSLHYFRVPRQYWEDRILKYKFAGLNTIQTYVEWLSHEPEPGKFNFNGQNNIFEFIELCQKYDLNLILRPGPYICAERDNGGLPYWLLKQNKYMKIRSSDQTYLKYVTRWMQTLLPKLNQYLYKNGGPIILVQVENEYGSYFRCDYEYLKYLRDLFLSLLGKDVVLFTTDGADDSFLKCGKIENVYATVDFGFQTEPVKAFEAQRRFEKSGPLINSEFYPGWLDHWAYPHQTVDSKLFCDKLDQILSMNASVNIYLLHGGTSFGFYAGANIEDNSKIYQPDPTSYDYNAPINEFGNLTQKFFDIKKVISKYKTYEGVEEIKKEYFVKLAKPFTVNLTEIKLSFLDIIKNTKPFLNVYPLSFEELGVAYGYVLYETIIPFITSDPMLLKVDGLNDRGYIYVNKRFQGIISRSEKIFSIPILAKKYNQLQILVENQGRVGFGNYTGERKGILDQVYLGNNLLKNWIHYGTKDWTNIINQVNKSPIKLDNSFDFTLNNKFFKGEFLFNEEGADTLINTKDWGKGVIFINGHNIGRFWPIVGPQITLYIPGVWLNKNESNEIIILELEQRTCLLSNECKIDFTDKHILDEITYYI